MPPRQSTGVPGLDEHLGGGLLPGALTVVVGATGIGKTQFGLQFAAAGTSNEARRGIVLDMSARGDSQHHSQYAERLDHWQLQVANEQSILLDDYFSTANFGDYLQALTYSGRRVTRSEAEFEQWQAWQAEVNRQLQRTIAFLYGNFVNGCRRLVVDGIEPVDNPAESIQFYLFDYVYHQIVRKDSEWVARDLLREHYREHAADAAARRYDPAAIGCLLLVTSHSSMLDDLISRPLSEGDALSNANTLIYMGKVRDGARFRRGLYIGKHRGSACSEEILYYTIGEQGLALE